MTVMKSLRLGWVVWAGVLLGGLTARAEIEPTWESLAANYQVPEWFVDGKIGVWFYRKTAVNRMSIPVMVGNAVDAISKNGVVMLNIALKGDGTIPDNQAAYLTAFGDFLRINGEGIYGSRPGKAFGEGPLKVKDGRQGENKKDFTQEDIRFTTRWERSADGLKIRLPKKLPLEFVNGFRMRLK